MNRLAPDQAQRDIATDVSRSVIVQAPAGSGKTTLLVDRYLRLLARARQPEEILAITFTRKAAAEMRSRVLKVLQSGAPHAVAALQRNKEMGWQLLEQPNRLKIQTIDSFAMTLSRQMPLSSGFDPDLALTESADELYARAADLVLLRLYQEDPLGDEIAEFLLQCGNDPGRAQNLLASMLPRRDQWISVVSAVVTAHREDSGRVRDVLQAGIAELNTQIITNFDQALSATERAELEHLITHAAAVLDLDISEEVNRYRLIGETFTTLSGELRKRVNKNQGFEAGQKELKNRVQQLIQNFAEHDVGERLANLRFLPEPLLDDPTAARLITICINLALAVLELNKLFKSAGVTDFTELLLSAQAALGEVTEPSDLALALDYRINHLLVDEFQDTSISQFRLFELLLAGWSSEEGNTFFAVGDPMQSIYRFRDAEVSLFVRAWESGIADMDLERVRLSSNFRADEQLVVWVNNVFATVLGSQNDPVMGRIAYNPSTPTVSNPEQHPNAVQVNLSASDSTQVSAIADRIEQLLRDEPLASIALLVRSRPQLIDLLPELRRRGIAWHANDIDPLVDKPVVRDLLAAIRLLSDPADRLGWLSVMRAPWVGLDLVDLEMFADTTDIAGALPGLLTSVSAAARQRLERLLAALATAIPMLHEFPPRTAIETFWITMGAVDAYADDSATAHAARLLELVDTLNGEALNPQALEQAAGSLFATDITESRLEILTIHKAKGLEFDHVILPFLERTTQSDEAGLLLWRSLPHGMLIGSKDDSGMYDWLLREEKARERHERQRLLYVACTRARDGLHLFATPGVRPSGTSLLNMLWPFVSDLKLSTSSAPPLQVELFEMPVDRTLQRLRADYQWQPPIDHPPVGLLSVNSAVKAQDHLAQHFEVALGLMVHRILEQLAAEAFPDDIDRYLATHAEVWLRQAGEYPLTNDEIPRLATAVTRQIRRVMFDDNGQWILRAQTKAYAEYPITGLFEGQLVDVVVDRTFLDDKGHRWLIDYKTAEPGPEIATDNFIAEEVSRYRSQLVRYQTLAQQLFAEPVAVGLYFTSIPHLEIIDPAAV